MKKRIWELDAFRGICILGMVLVHFVYDLVELYGIVQWQYPQWFSFVKDWGGILFLLVSGISATLGSHSVRRGVIVFACGLVVSAVTYGMYKLDFADKSIIIYFGVLQCLGSCMILWALYKYLPWWGLLVLGIVRVAAGYWLNTLGTLGTEETMWLLPLASPWLPVASSDYFPLLPNLGWFLIGGALGRTVYGKKESLIPALSDKTPVVNVLCFCGRHSLWIYLLHQPILTGICMALALIK